MKITPVQKQTSAGQRTRFKAFVIVGDHNGHLGLGVKCASEVATAIRGGIISAKLAVVPVRRGYWGSRFGEPHTVPCKVTGACGSVRFRIIPQVRGQSRTLGNFVQAVYKACANTYRYLTPDLWPTTTLTKDPYQEYSDYLKNAKIAKAAKVDTRDMRN